MAEPSPKKTTKNRVISKFLILCIYVIAGLEIVYTDELIAVRYLHFAYLAVFLIALGLFAYLVIKRSRLVIWFLPVFVFVSYQFLTPFIHLNSKQAYANHPAGNSYRFLSFSVNSRNANYEKVAQLLKQHPADVVCLQEVPYSRYQLLHDELKKQGVSYHHVYSKKQSLMILASQPVIPNKTMPYLEASIELDGKPLKIWNLHSPKSLTKENWQGFYFKKLKEDIDTDRTRHKLICGDFNSTPHNDIFKTFDKDFQPAYRASSQLINFTYPTVQGVVQSPYPFLKIDYLLFTSDFIIDHYERLPQYADSDHYPISAIARFQD